MTQGLADSYNPLVSSARYWLEAARNPKPGLDLDQVASQNYSLPLPVHRWVRARQLRFVENLMRATPGPRRVLDLGCGPGVFACELGHLADSWLGLDISPEFIEQARTSSYQRGMAHLTFRVSSLYEVEEQERFNLILLGGVLGYVPDAELPRLMEHVRRHLLPGGVVYVRVSVTPGLYPAMKLSGSYPIHYRKRKRYEKLFREAGFEVSRQRDYAFSDAALSVCYTAFSRWIGGTGMTAHRIARSLWPVSFWLARSLLDLTPLPQSMQFVLSRRTGARRRA